MVTTLEEGQEFETLKALSQGLVELVEENDFVFVDTSFLFNGYSSFDVRGLGWTRLYSFKTKQERKRFDLMSLKKVNIAYEEDCFISTSDLDDVYCIVNEELLRASFALSTLDDLLDHEGLLFPQEVYDESKELYKIAKDRLDSFTRKPKRKLRPRSQGIKSKRFGKPKPSRSEETSRRPAIVDKYRKDLIKSFKGNTSLMEGLLKGMVEEGKIVENGDSYDGDDYSDHRIIDTAMGYPGRVGIVTLDHHFELKIGEVARFRREQGLDIPFVNLLISRHNLERYEKIAYNDI